MKIVTLANGRNRIDRVGKSNSNMIGCGHWHMEIYFSVVQRKVLTPNDFLSSVELEQRLMDFQDYYREIAGPFEWKFILRTCDNLTFGEPDCGLDYFDPGFAFIEGFRYLGIGSLSECRPIPKIFAVKS